jgi:hypothetical protein
LLPCHAPLGTRLECEERYRLISATILAGHLTEALSDHAPDRSDVPFPDVPSPTTEETHWMYNCVTPDRELGDSSCSRKEEWPMRRTLTVILALVSATVIVWAADDTLGTWKYNTAKSKGAPGVSPISNLTVTREATEGGVKITAKGERADGSKIDTLTDAKYDGKPVTVTGSGLSWDTVAIKQVNDKTLTEERSMQSGKYRTTARTVVSKDGKTMTTTTKGTGADGKPIATTAVFDKQ